jgi:Domain of unknown function (DUF4349)
MRSPDVPADLRELVLDLQAGRPVPRDEFIRALDARAAAGFPKPQRRLLEAPRRLRPPRRIAPLALGSAAAVFIVATAVVAGMLSGGGSDERRPGDTKPVPAVGAEHARPSPSVTGAAGNSQRDSSSRVLVAPSSPAPPPSGIAPRARVRKVERAASITLAPPRDEIEGVADGVIRTADRYGGFVLDSSVSSGEREAGATIDLRIPSDRLEAAIADISKLAHVRARSQQALDITGRYTSPRRRLADAAAERRALLKELARAVTPNQTASVRARLRLVNRRIETARATLRRLENRVNYSAVSVSIEPGSRADGGHWTVGDAFGDAVTVLGVVAGAGLVGLAVLVPFALLIAVGWVARSAYLRRARERALGAVEKPIPR